jgi:hypothetical protein
VLQLREDLPDAGDRGPRLRGLHPDGCDRVADAQHGRDHVDREVPERDAEALQVPDPHDSGGQAEPSGGFKFEGDINDEFLFTEPESIGTDLYTLKG